MLLYEAYSLNFAPRKTNRYYGISPLGQLHEQLYYLARDAMSYIKSARMVQRSLQGPSTPTAYGRNQRSGQGRGRGRGGRGGRGGGGNYSGNPSMRHQFYDNALGDDGLSRPRGGVSKHRATVSPKGRPSLKPYLGPEGTNQKTLEQKKKLSQGGGSNTNIAPKRSSSGPANVVKSVHQSNGPVAAEGATNERLTKAGTDISRSKQTQKKGGSAKSSRKEPREMPVSGQTPLSFKAKNPRINQKSSFDATDDTVVIISDDDDIEDAPLPDALTPRSPDSLSATPPAKPAKIHLDSFLKTSAPIPPVIPKIRSLSKVPPSEPPSNPAAPGATPASTPRKPRKRFDPMRLLGRERRRVIEKDTDMEDSESTDSDEEIEQRTTPAHKVRKTMLETPKPSTTSATEGSLGKTPSVSSLSDISNGHAPGSFELDGEVVPSGKPSVESSETPSPSTVARDELASSLKLTAFEDGPIPEGPLEPVKKLDSIPSPTKPIKAPPAQQPLVKSSGAGVVRTPLSEHAKATGGAFGRAGIVSDDDDDKPLLERVCASQARSTKLSNESSVKTTSPTSTESTDAALRKLAHLATVDPDSNEGALELAPRVLTSKLPDSKDGPALSNVKPSAALPNVRPREISEETFIKPVAPIKRAESTPAKPGRVSNGTAKAAAKREMLSSGSLSSLEMVEVPVENKSSLKRSGSFHDETHQINKRLKPEKGGGEDPEGSVILNLLSDKERLMAFACECNVSENFENTVVDQALVGDEGLLMLFRVFEKDMHRFVSHAKRYLEGQRLL
eukprot:Plantae.Rhodophyta-Hildenbrandia_rubra.ctg9073.p1 GENE.Plantae.Rhodophyta-Hildenbrandia_rubra.ctg9073~~Plantae.Rhodophyta-Hildenbrandia_rubra.ctg9073.p1  ORF type:complete len:787 (+),score=141.43 Plantae.Rhodophyta-Hildenbrandia_rubra.ctg9073:222-2582(+)